MKNCYRTLSVLLVWLTLGLSASWAQDEVTYGFIQDPSDPLMITAVAYPNYSSTNVTISTAVFSFLLPEGTVTNPAIPTVPAAGAFNNITGIWAAQLVTPAVYGTVGNPADLMGNDVYQVVLQNSPSFTAFNPIVAGTPIELFSFILPNDCMNGNVEVLTNDSPIQMSILTNLGANFNNQMSMSINDAPATDIYVGNDPTTFSLPCMLNDTPTAVDDVATTDENTPVNIDVLVNDDFGNNGPNMGAIVITVVPPNGTATVNNNGTPNDPTDDTVDYTPDPGFAGTDVFTYQICDSDGDCDDADVTVTVLDAVIGIAKAASVPVNNGDGTFTTIITLNVENFGQVDLGDIQVTDDLSAFGTHVTLANLNAADE
ncbi:MAG: Ig-like domain-containing protein, partial [Chitinophagales bacterium]|nr:Ig-like domain-containing protein [Chitinophagales bacterium]